MANLVESGSALMDFIRESNRIEGIEREPFRTEVVAHELLLGRSELWTRDLQNFVEDTAHRPLRDRPGMDVRVGSHFPPPGGPEVASALRQFLADLNAYEFTPYEAHVEYETLHPFMDGNGRSGRAIWAWQMKRDGQDPFALPFLHRFYYQALDGARR